METRYLDRRDAGQPLAEALEHYRSEPPPIVLALPRGGVPVGYRGTWAGGVPNVGKHLGRAGSPGCSTQFPFGKPCRLVCS